MNTADTVNGSARYGASEHAIACEVDGETVLLHLQSGKYFGLNGVGSAIWNQVIQHKSVAEIQQHLLGCYKVSPERCEAEVAALLSQLAENGLVIRENGEAAY
jgi:hypothetical protein